MQIAVKIPINLCYHRVSDMMESSAGVVWEI